MFSAMQKAKSQKIPKKILRVRKIFNLRREAPAPDCSPAVRRSNGHDKESARGS